MKSATKQNMKNIMLISPFWTGVRSFFLRGENEFRGMPAFTNTFFSLLKNENVDKIFIVFFGRKIETNFKINKKYKNKIKIYGFSHSNGISALRAIILLFFTAIGIIIKNKISVIYGHGSTSGLAGIIGNLTRVPNVRRIYGTFLCDKLDKSKMNIFLKHPLEYFAFSLPAKAIICTNDGTKGDLVFNKIGHKKSPFYFWLNGIDKVHKDILSYEEVDKKYKIGFKPQICYLARIDIWKRQHLLVEALKVLSNKNEFYNTIIAGPIINKKYHQELKNSIEYNGLSKSVKLIPGLTKQESISVIKNSNISVSFYDFSNLGNVFLESISLGTVMLTENINNSLELIDNNLFYNTNPLDSEKTAEMIEYIFNNHKNLSLKSKEAVLFSHKQLLAWNQRADKELDLLDLDS